MPENQDYRIVGYAPQDLLSGPDLLNQMYDTLNNQLVGIRGASYPISGDARLLWESQHKES